jgi:twitching motility protein PilJ
MALLACELIPIIGLGVGSTLVLTNSLRTQLLSQAVSELAVTETNYNIKINQMGFGSRGQSDNLAIINAAKAAEQNQKPTADLQQQVKQILRNEVVARKMEYATLVSKDLKIIVNANADRTGQEFNPNNLVSQVLKNPQQLKASAIVPRDELAKEAPPLPAEFKNQAGEALIRYVITPVKDPTNNNTIAVLVFGDIVNSKRPIVEGTLKAFGGGYSGVYLRSTANRFTVATSLDQNQPQISLSERDLTFLEKAATAEAGKAVTQRLTIAGTSYTVAAKAVPTQVLETSNGAEALYKPEAPAILVRGTPEDKLNHLLWSSLTQEGLVFGLSIGVIIGWTMLFRRTVIKAIQNLGQATQQFAQGDRQARADIYSQDEIGQLAHQFNRMADSITASETALAEEALRQEQQAREAKVLSDIIAKMRGTLNFDNIIETATSEIRQLLKADRVVVYRFTDSAFNGVAIAESVVESYPKALGITIENLLEISSVENAKTQPFWYLNDVESATLPPRHREHLEHLQVKANLVAPIRRDQQLIGLLTAHQCSHARDWQVSEMNAFTQLATQIGYALDQAQLLQDKQKALQSAETLKDQLQQQILKVLAQVEGAIQGDLTVRAEVVTGDVGTIADFFNAIVENLREIVIKVQQSAIQVNHLLDDNTIATQQLAREAVKQSAETSKLLDSVGYMTRSIEAIAQTASQAAQVAQTAEETATRSETEMDMTVQKMTDLRSTIDDASHKVKQLGNSSQRISRILSLIQEFAVQTDLLAINAGLEASRAGENGRGFSIIAGEIGQLAARSAEATREIEQVVEGIQREVGAVVEAMTQGTRQAADGSHELRNTKQSMIQLVHVSQQINQLLQSISQTTVSQAETARSIQDLLKDISQLATQTSESSQQVSTALQQTVQVSQDLKRSVAAFTIDL